MRFWSWAHNKGTEQSHGKWRWLSGGRYKQRRLFGAPSRRHFYDNDKNENTCSEDDYQAAHLVEYGDDKTKHLADVGVRADDKRVLTDKIIYDVRPKEG